MKAIKSVKQCFESDNVIITKIIQGHNGMVRVDARTRYNVPDADNFFSRWVQVKYTDRLSMERYGKKTSNMNIFFYS